jgi:DNA-binding NarL/FixJ family response regulator
MALTTSEGNLRGQSATGAEANRTQSRNERQKAAPARRLRVFVADDHPLTLDGIKAAMRADPAVEIVGEASDALTALQRAIELEPDVAVLDLSMPGLDGVELARKLLAACPECRVLSLGLREDAPALRRLLDLGVAGYVLKSSESRELARCVHSIAQGGVYLDPGIAGALVGQARRVVAQAGAPEEFASLSARQVEVLRLSALGHSAKTIAARLQIGPKSVETYKARAMAKLGFSGRVDLIRFASAEGWLE